ncbi:hypothetical protein EYF70_29655 [Pseudoduganella albidiflava]|nr:hypothetical protein EYF70_29655 [Pseudoduganella albidiflava]
MQPTILPTRPAPKLPKCNSGTVDTALLIEEFKRIYSRDRVPVQVDFRKLVSWLKVGDQLTHQIHPYPAKLLPHIAHFFVHCNMHGGEKYVLDPFCGSGTVALEASLAGHNALVADANPLAILLTRVKTTPYNLEQLREATKRIVERAARLRTAPEILVVNSEKWYAQDVKRRLEILLRSIKEYDDAEIKEFFLVCFSATARKVSRIDPAIAVPVMLRTKDAFSEQQNLRILERLAWVEAARPLDEFFRICHANISRVEAANKVNPGRKVVNVVSNDARSLSSDKIPPAGVPLVITSPPYGTAQKYVRSSSLSLNWLELVPPHRLAEFEGHSIGREHSPAYRNEISAQALPSAYESLLVEVSRTNILRAHITRQYLLELKVALKEMHSKCAPGGRIVIVIGNNEVCGHTLFTNEYISQAMEDLGCQDELVLVDQIKSRGLLTKRNKTASVIAKEFIMVFKKAK